MTEILKASHHHEKRTFIIYVNIKYERSELRSVTELLTKQTATAYGKFVAGEVCTSLDVKSLPGSPEKGEEFTFGLSLLKIKTVK